jgi:von Willebrand factor type D domain/RTX calcium-binding nonapeptide repeat (4 copies)/Calx-beta domain
MPDTRVEVPESSLGNFPFNSVVAVDAVTPTRRTGELGTGFAIAPGFFLTAGHIVIDVDVNVRQAYDNGRVTVSYLVPSLTSRKEFGQNAPFNFNKTDVSYPENFDQFVRSPGNIGQGNTEAINRDIALIKGDGSTRIPGANIATPIGLIAFVDARSAIGLGIASSGYPVDFIDPVTKEDSRILVTTPNDNSSISPPFYPSPFPFFSTAYVQLIKGNRRGKLNGLSVNNGQSGSPVVTRLDNDDFRAIGIISTSPGATTQTSDGFIITTDTYKKIINQIASDSGTADGNILPENAIIGSEPSFIPPTTTLAGGDDLIYGTYRRERIIGGRGNDKLFGGGGDDRLEGGEGEDEALFSDEYKNYSIKYNPSDSSFDVTHIGGTKSEGKDNLKDIEYAIFGYTDNNNDGKDDDDKVFRVKLDPSLSFIDTEKIADGLDYSSAGGVSSIKQGLIGTFISRLPVWSVDGDVDYELSLSLDKPELLDRVNVKLNGVLIKTILPDEFIAGGNTSFSDYKGVLDNLDVSPTAKNQVSFEAVLNDGSPPAVINRLITSGQEQSTVIDSDGKEDLIVFGFDQLGFTQVQSDNNAIIYGNDFDNSITTNGGFNQISAGKGNDRIILNGGESIVFGDEGIDTVKINKTRAAAGEIKKSSGGIINIGNDSFVDVEFVEFDDATVSVVPLISLKESVVSVQEGNQGSGKATFTVNLSTVADSDVIIAYEVDLIRSATAEKNLNPASASGQIIIPAGQTSGKIDVDILDDTDVGGDRQVYLNLQLASVDSGESFVEGSFDTVVAINIEDDESEIVPVFLASSSDVIEGDPNRPSSLVISLERIGNTKVTDVLEYQIAPTGSKPATAGDLIDGFNSGLVTFLPGETENFIEIPISPNSNIDGDKSFNVNLKSLSGSSVVFSQPLEFTILDDDAPTVVLSVTATTPTATETQSVPGVFRVTSNTVANTPLTFGYTLSGTAVNGSDFDALLGTATIAAGQSFVDISVTPADDTLVEGSETVSLTLDTGAGYTINPLSPSATVTIIDNDSQGSSNGDPHIITFDGLHYDFQATGDFTLVSGLDSELNIQVRQTPWALNLDTTINTGLATVVDGNRVEFYIDQSLPLIDNLPLSLALGETLALGKGSITRTAISGYGLDGNLYTITYPSGDVLKNAVYSGFLIDPTVTLANGHKAIGLLGNNNGDVRDDLALQNGTIPIDPLTPENLYGAFANSWKVPESESLFSPIALNGIDPLIVSLDLQALAQQYVFGGNGDDTLIGSNTSIEPGRDGVDLLMGNKGADTFVLGDKNGQYYVGSGLQDYAIVTDLWAEDRIQLHGSASNYVLGNSPAGSANGTGIFLDNNSKELLGIIQGTKVTNLDLSDPSVFCYI